jgi:hypothetical protein
MIWSAGNTQLKGQLKVRTGSSGPVRCKNGGYMNLQTATKAALCRLQRLQVVTIQLLTGRAATDKS